MNIDNETKMIIDTENKYLFDENDIIVILKENNDLDILREYSNKKYSIGGSIVASDNAEYKIIKNYGIINETQGLELEKSNSAIFSLLSKVNSKINLNPLGEDGILLKISFDEIRNM